MPPPMVVRLAADLRPPADGSAARTSPAAGQLQAASVPTAQAGTDTRTNGSPDRLTFIPPAHFLNILYANNNKLVQMMHSNINYIKIIMPLYFKSHFDTCSLRWGHRSYDERYGASKQTAVVRPSHLSVCVCAQAVFSAGAPPAPPAAATSDRRGRSFDSSGRS